MVLQFNSICDVDLEFSGIPYREFLGSDEYETGTTERTTRMYITQWDDGFELAKRLVGRVVAAGLSLVWELPQRDPKRDWLYAQSVRGEGLGAPSQDPTTGAIRYDAALLTVEFGQRPNDQTDSGVTFVTERRSSSSKTITIPEEKVVWGEGADVGKPIGDDARAEFKIPLTVLTVDVHWWVSAPTDLTFENLMSDVNEFNFQILQTVFPPGTLRFDFANRRRQFTSEGISAWQVTFQFTFNRFLWNKKFNPNTDIFELVETAGGTKIHRETDFGIFFPLGI
jgi:hypothetical protein